MNMPDRVEQIRQHTVFAGPVFDLVDEQIRLANGITVHHLTVRHPGAVVIIPRQADGTLLVIRQYRHSVHQTLLEFPAGTRHPGEAPLECARRELAEEVGRVAYAWESVGEFHPAPGFCNEVQYGFVATDLQPCEATRDADELIEVLSMHSAQLEQAIRDGIMTDGKSIALYLRAKLRGLV
jgi:ADP-ribose pyrophosphatase